MVTGAADGYGRMAGKPAFTLLHVGSAVTANGIANLHKRRPRHNTPMVNIVGANASYQPNFPNTADRRQITDLAPHGVPPGPGGPKSRQWAGAAGGGSRPATPLTGSGRSVPHLRATSCHWDPGSGCARDRRADPQRRGWRPTPWRRRSTAV